MDMRKVSVDDVDLFETGDSELDKRSLRPLTEALDITGFAMNHYVLKPGEAFSAGLHTHLDQEEVFYIYEGEVVFRTADEEIEVGAGEAIRFAPGGEYQRGVNEGENPVKALALGAPNGPTEIRLPQSCNECNESEELEAVFDSTGMVLRCPECDATFET